MIRYFLLCSLAVLPFPLPAQVELDTSLSPREQLTVQFHWANTHDVFELGAEELTLMRGEVSEVEVRLDTRPFRGQQARIFLRLPDRVVGLRAGSALRLEWVTRGLFEPGETTPGNRALIYEGVIDDAVLRDFFSFTLWVDARQMSGVLRFEPIYEIETP